MVTREVWAVVECYPYDGEQVVEVCASREVAEARMETVHLSYRGKRVKTWRRKEDGRRIIWDRPIHLGDVWYELRPVPLHDAA